MTADLTQSISERRAGNRHPVIGSASAQIALSSNPDNLIACRPFDLSARGIGIWSKKRLERNSTVYMKRSSTSEELIQLRVRWCKANYHNTQYYRCGLEATDKNLDLTRELSDVKFEKNSSVYSEAMALMQLGSLARDIAHDINNSTQIIKLMSENLASKVKPADLSAAPEYVESLQVIQRNASWIGTVVSTLRTFSAPIVAKIESKVSLQKVLDDAEVLSGPRFKHANVKLEFTPSRQDSFVLGSDAALTRAVLNLLNNAFDAVHKEEGGWVRVDVVDLGTHVEIGVMNLGKPLPKQKWQELCRPFNSSKKTSFSGLGLDISARIIADHQGQLEVDPHSKNCRITITLPKYNEQAQS